jgi:hypothetical protein
LREPHLQLAMVAQSLFEEALDTLLGEFFGTAATEVPR